MSSMENVLSAKTSSHSRHSYDKQRGDLIKKRTSSSDETNIRNSLHQLQESIDAINFPYPISFEECRGLDDVHIYPSYMEFKDGSEGNVMRQTLSLRNVGKKAAIVRLHKPNSMIFQVNADAMQERKLYPGLSLLAQVKYTYQVAASLHALIPIEINGTTLDYHLICTFSAPHVVAEPSLLDFGSVNVDSVSDLKTLSLRNTGAKTARFSVDVGTSHLINIQPERGFVKPNDKVLLKVQLMGKYEGVFNASIWIKSKPNICISVMVQIIQPKLFVDCFTKADESVLIDFLPTYLETRRDQNLTVKNNSSQATSFVIMTKECQHYKSISEIIATKNPSFDAFKIKPSTGRLLPFEEATLSISFCPTFKNLELLRKLQKDQSFRHFVAVIKIFKVAVAEAKPVLKRDPRKVKKVEQNIPQVCAQNQSAKEKLEESSAGEELEGAVETTLYLHGQVEIPCLMFEPDELYLQDLNIDDRVEQPIRVTNPSQYLPLKFKFVAQPWVHCQPNQAYLKPTQSVQVLISIRAQFNLEAVFYLGFDAWAASVDENDFRKPSNVMVSRISLRCVYKPLKAPAQVKTCRNLCRVASLNKLPLEKDYSLTYTQSQLNLKKNHREYWTYYFRAIFSRKRPASRCTTTTEASFDSSPFDDDYFQVDTRYCGDRLIVKACKQQQRVNSTKDKTQENIRDKVSKFLSPLKLFKVHVSPLKLDFGKVVKHSQSYLQLTFENRNVHEMTIGLISLNESCVTFPDKALLTIKPGISVSCRVGFRAENFGKFHSYVNYTINHEHKYQLPLLANVVFKNLKLNPKEIVFERDCHPLEGYRLPFKFVEVKNELNADTAFKWIMPENSNFCIEPRIGCVPAKKSLYVSLYHELDAYKSNRIEAAIQDEDKGCANLKVEATLRAPNVSLLDDSSDLGEIPLNLAHTAKITLYNAEYFGVFFEVDRRSLLKGIDVEPTEGTIPPRGIIVLTARFFFDVCIECATQIDILVQKRLPLQWKVKFSVAFPKLRFEPSVIDWAKLCVNSYRVQPVSLTNLTDAKVLVRFALKHYNEFHVSTWDLKGLIPITRGDSCYEIRPQSTIQLFLHFMPCDIAHCAIDLPLVINELLGPVSIDDRESAQPTKFLRTNDEYYSNVKGITILSIPAKLPTIYVNSIVTQPIVCFNKLTFQFSDTCRQDKWKCCNNSQEPITLVLHTKVCNQAPNFPFAICWVSGPKPKVDENAIAMSLKPKEYVHFRILFNPKERGHFAFELPISLDEVGDEPQTYNKLILAGLYPKASIQTEILEIILAPVSLETTRKHSFDIQLSNFTDKSSLCFECCSPERSIQSATEIPDLLNITFPRGNTITPYCSHSLQVQVEFASAFPVSFCTSLAIFDKEKSSSIYIRISATADNSLLTTHAHKNQNSANILIKKLQPNNTIAAKSREEKNIESQVKINLNNEAIEATSNISSDEQEISNGEHDFEKLEKASYCERASNWSDGSVATDIQYASIDSTIAQHEKDYLKGVAKIIEAWLYDQVLHYEFHPSLFDGKSLAIFKSELLENVSKNDKKKEYPKLCTYADILARLASSEEVLPFDDSERASRSSASVLDDPLGILKKIMHWLLAKGAWIAQYSAEYFLNYEDYKKLTSENYRLDRDSFQFRSQSAWIDLLLQSYKIFTMSQISEECLTTHKKMLNHTTSIDSTASEFYAIDVNDIIRRSERHSQNMAASEALLLAWLEFNRALHFKARDIDEFGKCLSDSLAFIALTINYCPYLKDFFANVYADPITEDQKVHNAICLLLAWKKIRIGFTVTPSQIVEANAIQMLMLSHHLFKYLPTYLVKDKVTLTCPLTKSTSTQIRLFTNSNHQVTYVVQFIGNDLDVFNSKTIVSMSPNKTQQIKVNFLARKILRTTAYLVLCGSAIGPHFAENQVFLLEGFPDELEISESFSFSTKLYQMVKKNLSINVPYEDPNEYEIWMSRERPSSIDQLETEKWESTRPSKYALNRLTIHNSSLTVEENLQTADLTVTLACLTCESQSFWIIFRSKLADFIVQITSNYRISITDSVSIKITSESCICPDFPTYIDFDCPLIHSLLIPTENIQMHNCVLKLFKTSLADEDRDFWTRYLDNKIGLRFVKWFIKDSACSTTDNLINFNQKYNITTDKNSILLQQLEGVNDGSGNDQIQLMIHICGELADVKKTLITLTSLNKKEMRVCQVDFTSDESSAGSVQSKSKTKK